jgi:alkylhydroperoxidase/carboxymuconolactone decarboxylase family protein YurZ
VKLAWNSRTSLADRTLEQVANPTLQDLVSRQPDRVFDVLSLPWMDPRFRELVALAVLAAVGCGLALSQDSLLFAAIFDAACAATIIEAIRFFRPQLKGGFLLHLRARRTSSIRRLI